MDETEMAAHVGSMNPTGETRFKDMQSRLLSVTQCSPGIDHATPSVQNAFPILICRAKFYSFLKFNAYDISINAGFLITCPDPTCPHHIHGCHTFFTWNQSTFITLLCVCVCVWNSGRPKDWAC